MTEARPQSFKARAICEAIDALRDKALEAIKLGDDRLATYYADCIREITNLGLNKKLF